jgi:D-psicose/D-tagatose/L-ribulose 3-epimerase
MKFGVNTLIWTAGFDRSHLSLLPQIKEHGFDGVEIARFDFAGFPAAGIRKNLAENGLACTFCSALTGELSVVSGDAGVRGRALAFLRDGIQVAAELGARTFSGPFCAPVGYLPGRRRTEEEWRLAVEGLESLGDTLLACDVTLAIEPLNRFETYFLNTTADASALCDAVNHPRVGILFDTFHANIEEKEIGAAARSLGKHLKHVHTCENDRGVPGSGHIEWPALFQALGDLHYDGWLVIESFGFAIKEIAAAACIWRDLAPAPETIAFEGLKFLKQQ